MGTKAGQFSSSHLRARDDYYVSKHGLQFGAPAHAISHAISKMRATESSMRRAQGTSSASEVTSSATGEFSGTLPAVSFANQWTFIGPQPISEKANFTGTPFGSSVPMTGRVTGVAADSKHVIVVGTASGGVWLSTNDGASFASVFDSGPTQAIGAVALDTSSLVSTIYVATGEGNSSLDSLYGQGIFRSTDLGQTWASLGPANTFDHVSFTSIAIDRTNPQRIFAGATNGLSASRADAGIFESDASKAGLWRSTDGGANWTHYAEQVFGGCDLVSNGSGQAPCAVDDVKIDPGNSNIIYVAVDGSDIYFSTNGGDIAANNWHAALLPGIVDFNTPPNSCPASGCPAVGRESIAIGPPAGFGQVGAVYTMIGDGQGVAYLGAFVSTSSGSTWAFRPVPQFFSATDNLTIDGGSTGANTFSQSFYDQALLVSPAAAGTVYFGGVGLYRSTDFGNSWNSIFGNGGIHSDFHALAADPVNGKILAGTDGGVFSFVEGAGPTFSSLNQTISASQIQGIGPHPSITSKAIAGFQSNGTQLYSGGIGTWVGPDSENGDGGFAFFDPNDPLFVYHDFSFDAENLISASKDGGTTWCSAPAANPAVCNVGDSEWSPNLNAMLTSANDPGPSFYAPIAVDPLIPHRVFFAAHGVYVSTDGMAHWTQQTDFDLTSAGNFGGKQCADQTCALIDLQFAPSDHTHAWALAGSSLDGTVAFALNNTIQADVDKIDNNNIDGGVWNDVTGSLAAVFGQGQPSGVIVDALATQATSIAVDPHNPIVAYIGLSGFTSDTLVGHIYRTADFGRSWTEVDGSSNNGKVPGASPLPDVPVLKVMVDGSDNTGTCGTKACSKSIFVGTDIGVFHSSDGGATWQPFNLGVIPAVPVYDLAQNSTGAVFAGTHGRGAYLLNLLTATATPTRTSTPTATPTPKATATATATATASATRTATATATSTSGTPTKTATATATSTNGGTPTKTATPTATSTSGGTPTRTATPTTTSTSGGTPTTTSTPTATATSGGTNTATATATPTSQPTSTPNDAKIVIPAAVIVKPVGIGLGASAPKNFSIKNVGKSGNLTGDISLDPSSGFVVAPTHFDLPPKASQVETVTLTPTGTTALATAIVTSTDAKRPMINLTLKGKGLPGKLSIKPAFTLSGTAGVTTSLMLPFKNAGKGVLGGSWPDLATGAYTIHAGTFGPLQPGETGNIPVDFAPAAKGKVAPVPLLITVNSPGVGGRTITLKGVGK